MHMYTVKVFINKNLFTVYKDMFFVSKTGHVQYRNGMLIYCSVILIQCTICAHSKSYSRAPACRRYASEASYLRKFDA